MTQQNRVHPIHAGAVFVWSHRDDRRQSLIGVLKQMCHPGACCLKMGDKKNLCQKPKRAASLIGTVVIAVAQKAGRIVAGREKQDHVRANQDPSRHGSSQ
jgi:ribosomal protein L35AE/L33A